MAIQPIFKKLAKYYDIVYSKKEYKKEAEKIHKLIKKNKKSKGKELLDVACGTGGHDNYFKKWYNVTGIDLSSSMLAIAKKKVRGVKFLKGNMQTFKLKKKFDVITCLFTAFNYNISKALALKTLKNFYHHLKPGGVIIFDVWAMRKPKNPKKGLRIIQTPRITLVRFSESNFKVNRFDIIYYIQDKNKVLVCKESHKLGAFKKAELTQKIKQAGFKKIKTASFKPYSNNTLFIAVK